MMIDDEKVQGWFRLHGYKTSRLTEGEMETLQVRQDQPVGIAALLLC